MENNTTPPTQFEVTESFPFIIYKGCIYTFNDQVPEGATILNAPNVDTAMGYLSEHHHNEVVNDLQTKLNYFQDHADIFKASSDKFEQENEQLKTEIERLKSEVNKLNKVEIFRYEHGFDACSIIYLINGEIHLYSIPMYGGEEREDYIDFIDLEDLIEKIKKFT